MHNAHRPVRSGPVAIARRAVSGGRSEDGQALVEFALVLPIFVVLLLGIGLFGFALNDWIDETQVASQAARFAAVDSEYGTGELKESTFLTKVVEQADSQQLKEKAKAEMCSPTSAVGDYVKVKLTYTYNWLNTKELPLGVKLPETAITSTATMRIEVPPKEPSPGRKAYNTHFAGETVC